MMSYPAEDKIHNVNYSAYQIIEILRLAWSQWVVSCMDIG